jgi:hypothetical protein
MGEFPRIGSSTSYPIANKHCADFATSAEPPLAIVAEGQTTSAPEVPAAKWIAEHFQI